MLKGISVLLCFVLCASLFSFAACSKKENPQSRNKRTLKNASAAEDAEKAYLFGFPIVFAHLNERVMTNSAGSHADNMPLNSFRHGGIADINSSRRPFADPDFFVSSAWLALEKEPLVLEIPDTGGRYAFFTLTDAWTAVTASLGTRTADPAGPAGLSDKSGREKQIFLIASPDWNGETPEGMRLIKVATNMAKIEGKIQINNTQDGKTAAAAIQKKIKLAPLSLYKDESRKAVEKTADPAIDMSDPVKQLFDMDVSAYFNLLNALLADNPSYLTDKEFLESVRYLNIAPGEEFDLSVFDAQKQEEMKKIPEKVRLRFEERAARARSAPGWTAIDNASSVPDADYEKRALKAYESVNHCLPEDMIKMRCFADSANEPLDGRNNYVLRFAPGAVPESGAFWSLAAYDSKGFLRDNPLNRYSVSDRKTLKAKADGSVEIYIRRSSPGKAKENAWLPVPEERFSLILSVCRPKGKTAGNGWTAPPVEKQ